MRIQPGQQGGPRRATAACVVELGEAKPAGRETIEIRRANLASVAADIGVAHVISHDDDDVGARRGCQRNRKQEERWEALHEQHCIECE